MVLMKADFAQEILSKCKHPLLKTATVIESRFHSQSLFPLYCLSIRTAKGKKIKIAVKELREQAMASMENDDLDSLYQLEVPCPRSYGYVKAEKTDKFFLFMDFIESQGGYSQTKYAANLHKDLLLLYFNSHERFGWSRSNYIGPIKQSNHWHESFYDFWWKDRIFPQIKRGQEQSLLSEKIAKQMETLIGDCCDTWALEDCKPRLTHGDLWSGNLLPGPQARVFIIDPSLSYSNIEQDLGMLGLFGSLLSGQQKEDIAVKYGAGPNFYQRNSFWQIYPLLVHVNLFGSSYLSRLQASISTTLSYI